MKTIMNLFCIHGKDNPFKVGLYIEEKVQLLTKSMTVDDTATSGISESASPSESSGSQGNLQHITFSSH